jgi:threonine dehydrogenase-like Zn-dependent dehydrogenase
MKAAIFRAIEQIEVTDVPKPEPSDGRAEFSAAIEFVAQRRVDVESWASHEIALDEVVTRGFDVLDRPAGAVKILVRIGGES